MLKTLRRQTGRIRRTGASMETSHDPTPFLTLSKRLTALVCLAVLSFAAQAYPDKPITLVVPNPAGGAADNLARGFAEEMGKRLKQTVVVENVGGASGALGAQKVLRSAPDGYTLIFGTTSDMVVTRLIANPNAGYATKDFTPIALVGLTPMALVARNNLGVAGIDPLYRPGQGQAQRIDGGHHRQQFVPGVRHRGIAEGGRHRPAGRAVQRGRPPGHRLARRPDRPGRGRPCHAARARASSRCWAC